MADKKQLPTNKDVRTSPKDTVEEAVIIDYEITTWGDKNISDEAKAKLKAAGIDLEAEQVFFSYETKSGYKDEFIAAYYEKPSDMSKLGKILATYGSAEPGTVIKVHFDSKGKGTVQL